MAYERLKPTVIVNTALGLLKQDMVAASLFWKDGLPDFAGAANDTVTLRLPAYAEARTRTMRSSDGVTMDDLFERAIDVKLDTHLYHATRMSDEQLTLDIPDFGAQVLAPQTEAVARGLEAKAVATMVDADYERELTMDPSNPRTVLVQARRALNAANVPHAGRYLAMGADVEDAFLNDQLLNRVDESGSSSVLRQATIGNLYGFTLVSVPGLPNDTAIAFHNTSFALATRAPIVPAGVAFGQSASFENVAMRWLRDYSDQLLADRSLVDMYCGTAVVTDNGTLDSDGKFTPSVDPSDGTDMFLRAVKITVAEAPLD